jgi:beta-barrel assembly-enhancing protease
MHDHDELPIPIQPRAPRAPHGYVEMPDSINVSPRNPILEFIKYTSITLGSIVGFFWIATTGIGLMVPHLPPSSENWLGWIGDEHIATLEKKKEVKDNETLTKMMRELEAHSPVPSAVELTVHEGQGDTLNAFALPGGHIVLYKSLMNQLPSEDARRFVLAHEMGHVANRHSMQAFGKIAVIGMLAVPINLVLPEVSGQLFGLLNLNSMQHSQAKELEADRYAIELLKAAGSDPRAGIEVFELLESHAGGDATPDFMKSHPPSEARITQIKRYAP